MSAGPHVVGGGGGNTGGGGGAAAASQQQPVTMPAATLQIGVKVCTGGHAPVAPTGHTACVGGGGGTVGTVASQQQLVTMLAEQRAVKGLWQAVGIPTGHAATVGGGGGLAQRLLSQQQPGWEAPAEAPHRWVKASPVAQAWAAGGQKLDALPAAPHWPAEVVWAAQLDAVVVPQFMQVEVPAVTTRQVLVKRSHGRCTSSSACPSQQSSKPRASNS